MRDPMLWEIVDFSPDFSVTPGRCGFAIWVSPAFTLAARTRMQKLLKESSLEEFILGYNEYWSRILEVRGMDYMIPVDRSIVEFDKDGLKAVKIAGNACSLYWDKNRAYVERRGGRYETHNVDNSMQFLTLFIIFAEWAGHVKQELRKLGLEKNE